MKLTLLYNELFAILLQDDSFHLSKYSVAVSLPLKMHTNHHLAGLWLQLPNILYPLFL